VLADDFGFLIALQALGTGVPARYHAVRVQHIEGIIDYRLDQEAVPPIFG
jgi:hypothetical protein